MDTATLANNELAPYGMTFAKRDGDYWVTTCGHRIQTEAAAQAAIAWGEAQGW